MRYLFPLVLVLSACASVHESSAPAGPHAKPGEEFRLALGESAPVESTPFAVTFLKVLEDSRCATGHSCVWEGNARIEVGVLESLEMGETPDGKAIMETSEDSVELNTSSRFPTSTRQGYWVIELLRLEPSPRADAPPADYVATLLVRKP